MLKYCLFGLAALLIVSIGLICFQLYQISVAYSVLQGFWLIKSSEDGDIYLLINDGDIQLVSISESGMELLGQETIDLSLRSIVPINSFKYKLSREGSTTLDQLFDSSKDIEFELFPAVGCIDMRCNKSVKRLIKDNSMSLSYLMS